MNFKNKQQNKIGTNQKIYSLWPPFLFQFLYLQNDFMPSKKYSYILFHSSAIAVLIQPIFGWYVAFVLFSTPTWYIITKAERSVLDWGNKEISFFRKFHFFGNFIFSEISFFRNFIYLGFDCNQIIYSLSCHFIYKMFLTYITHEDWYAMKQK